MKIQGNCTLWLLVLLGVVGCAGAPDGAEDDQQQPKGKSEQAYSFGNYYGGPGGDPWTLGSLYSNVIGSIYFGGRSYLETGNLVAVSLNCDAHPTGIGFVGQMYQNSQVLASWSPTYTWHRFGSGNGGLVCDDGQYIIGMWGTSGTYVNELGFVCGPPDHSTAKYGNLCGNTAGGTMFLEFCPPGMIATGFTGRGGSWLDGIQMFCNAPFVAPPLVR